MYDAPRNPDERFTPRDTPWALFGSYLAGIPGTLWIGAAASITSTVTSIVLFWGLGLFVDATFAQNATPSPSLATIAVVGGSLLVALHFAGVYANEWAITRIITWNWLRPSHHVVSHAVDIGSNATKHHKSGDLVSTAITDADLIRQMAFVCTHFGLQIVVRVLLTGIVALTLSWRVGLALLIGSIASVWLSTLSGRLVSAPTARARKADAHMTALSIDGLSGIRILRGLGAVDVLLTRYETASEQVRVAEGKKMTARALNQGWGVLCAYVLLAGVSGYAVFELSAGRLTVGALTTLVSLAVSLVPTVAQTAVVSGGVAQGSVALKRILKVLQTPTAQEVAGPTSQNGTVTTSGALRDEVTGTTFTPGQLTVVDGDPHHVAEMLHRMGRLDVQSHPATVGGNPLSAWPLASVREAIVVSDPRPQLLSGTLRSQVDPSKNHSDHDVLAALHVASADEVVDLLPLGLGDYVTEKGRSLSGGQQQRVALARVMLRNPPICLLIEPTSAVDAPTELVVAQRVAARRAGMTTVVATNSPLWRSVANQVVTL